MTSNYLLSWRESGKLPGSIMVKCYHFCIHGLFLPTENCIACTYDFGIEMVDNGNAKE